ncbi:hypothetical protein SC09_Contig19orf00772 [Bacillus subtilis]|uniref:Uncharacterized protein n=1 Tax=Bacillus subtilis TaxID=1423 RepID=A0A0D1L910_BACIU|nr:hypothetical protein SC09_Contig19orf00772 [Bacillus subtilis]
MENQIRNNQLDRQLFYISRPFKAFREITGYKNKCRHMECVNELVEVEHKMIIINKGTKDMTEYNKEY